MSLKKSYLLAALIACTTLITQHAHGAERHNVWRLDSPFPFNERNLVISHTLPASAAEFPVIYRTLIASVQKLHNGSIPYTLETRSTIFVRDQHINEDCVSTTDDISRDQFLNHLKHLVAETPEQKIKKNAAIAHFMAHFKQ